MNSIDKRMEMSLDVFTHGCDKSGYWFEVVEVFQGLQWTRSIVFVL